MRISSAISTLTAFAGLAASTLASQPDLQLLDSDRLVPTRTAGILYVNLTTGERTLTRYDLTEIPEITSTHTPAGGGLFDYWMSIDENPCWDDSRAQGFGFDFENFISDYSETPATQPAVAWDYGDMPFDSKITGVVLSTATLAIEDTDSNNDGILDTGIDTVAVFYDALSEGSRASIAPPTAAVRVESIPGYRGGDTDLISTVLDFDIIVDFGGEHFELGDSDGLNRGSMWLPGAPQGLDVVITTENGFIVDIEDGLADFQYLQYYAQHASNDKVTEDSVFIGFGAPEGEVTFTTYTYTFTTTCPWGTHCLPTTPTTVTRTTTVTESFLIPDSLPQGQGVKESFGIGTLGLAGDTTNIDWSPGGNDFGCCYWLGGIDCAGFLDQLIDDPPFNSSWYNFTPFSQISLGLFSDSPHESACGSIDYNVDGILDNGDIGLFLQLFLQQDLATDMNSDGVCDNGDIGVFINLFLACTG